MNYTKAIFERANIQHIREFLINGVECYKLTDKSYEQRIDDAENTAFNMISAKFPDLKECELMMDLVSDYASEMQNVYMEIGLQTGILIAIQILGENGKFI